jgi:uncharacterized protein YigA (DUF484 family)
MPASQMQRLWLIGGGFAAFLMVLVGYTVFISPQRSNTTAARSQVSAAQTRNATLQARINALQAQSKNLAQYQDDVAQAQLALPSTSGLPDFLRTLQSIGAATQANVTSLSVGPPTDVTGIAGTSGAAKSPTTRTPKSTSTTLGGVRVYALPITAQISGTDAQLDQFLVQLQSVQPRAVLISGLTEGTGTGSSKTPGSSGMSLQLTMQAFVAPISAAEQEQLSAASGR